MFLFDNTIRANSKTIRGVQYVVFSHYNGHEAIHDRVGSMIINSFEQNRTVEITQPSLVSSDIAFSDE